MTKLGTRKQQVPHFSHHPFYLLPPEGQHAAFHEVEALHPSPHQFSSPSSHPSFQEYSFICKNKTTLLRYPTIHQTHHTSLVQPSVAEINQAQEELTPAAWHLPSKALPATCHLRAFRAGNSTPVLIYLQVKFYINSGRPFSRKKGISKE